MRLLVPGARASSWLSIRRPLPLPHLLLLLLLLNSLSLMMEDQIYHRMDHLPGRYRYLRASMGLSSSSDEWCRHSDRVIKGFPWCRKIVDDILVWASTPSELETRLHSILQRCEKLHVTLSLSKLHIDNTLKFAGCVISYKGVFPDPDRISALSQVIRPVFAHFLVYAVNWLFSSQTSTITLLLSDNRQKRGILLSGFRNTRWNSIP